MTQNSTQKMSSKTRARVGRVVVLGATGSVGATTMDVLRQSRDSLRVAGLAARRARSEFADLVCEFAPDLVSVGTAADAARLRTLCKKAGMKNPPEIVSGVDGLCRVASMPGADRVVNVLGGSAGLRPSLAALEAGKTLLTANKESLVAAGELIMDTARRRHADILPLDSEHSAIFQCLRGENPATVRRVILTASGGPFLRRKSLRGITPAQALKHPRWIMGPKVTVDSATLMNKGLEIIEAARLFGLRSDQVHVVIHPQSVVHSMVEFCDGSIIAQLGAPDMRTPVAYALHYPQRAFTGGEKWLSLSALSNLTFEEPDTERFPCMELARAALEQGGALPAALSAADEIAVQAFADEKIAFTDIPLIIEAALENARNRDAGVPASLEHVLAADAAARRAARRAVRALTR
jgi:1-deoxy-D-xylulose-5-phosphate reductoisomerase